MIPITNDEITEGDVHPSRLERLAPITNPGKPIADSIIESQSTCGLVILLTFSNKVIAKISASNKKGTNNQKI